MHTVELQIPPKVLLKVFGAKNVGTGMSCEVPGNATVTVEGKGKHHDPSLVPVVLKVWSNAGIDEFSGWLCDKLRDANERQIYIDGVEKEATAEEVAKAISETVEVEREWVAGEDSEPVRVRPVLAVQEEEIVSSGGTIVCLRMRPGMVREEYVQGSTIEKCSVCQCDVLAAPLTQAILAQGENEIVCIECWTEANPAEAPSEPGPVKRDARTTPLQRRE